MEAIFTLFQVLGQANHSIFGGMCFFITQFGSRGPFLESPGNLTDPKPYFEIKISRKVGCVLTTNEVHFVSLADNLTVQFSKLLKFRSGMENKTA